MSDHDQHCPFLNRSDDRCSKNFSLERLNKTYDHCFGEYAACSIYLEMLVERRIRRTRENVLVGGADACGRDRWQLPHRNPTPMPVVSLTYGGRRLGAA